MSSYICMPSHQYIGVEWVTSGFLSKGVYCLRVHYGLVRFLNPLAQSQAHILITPLSFLSANESQRKVGRTFLVETDAKYRIEQTTREKQWRVVWGKVKVKVKKLNNLPSKKNRKLLRKTKKKTLVETVAKYRVEQTPEKNSDMLCEESMWGKCHYSSCWRIIC